MSDTTKHTPGPWTIDEDHDGSSASGAAESLNLIIESPSAEEHIAFVFDDKTGNAHLIAAAPDLLEACRSAVNALMLNPECCQDEINATVTEIHAAIAKAEGRTS